MQLFLEVSGQTFGKMLSDQMCGITETTEALEHFKPQTPCCTVGQAEEVALNEALVGSSGRVHAALLDSINLVGAMEALFELVRAANRYMDEREAHFAASPAGERAQETPQTAPQLLLLLPTCIWPCMIYDGECLYVMTVFT